MLTTPLAASDQIGPFQNTDVLGNGVQRNRKGCGDIGNPRLASGQPRQDRPARGIGEGHQRVVESTIFTHLDEYLTPHRRACKPLNQTATP